MLQKVPIALSKKSIGFLFKGAACVRGRAAGGRCAFVYRVEEISFFFFSLLHIFKVIKDVKRTFRGVCGIA